ncbi:MAG: outer membrane protein assembly factor BamD [Acidobacteriota bacterium]
MDSTRLRLILLLLILAVGCGKNPKPTTPANIPSDQVLYDQGTAALEKEDWDKGRTLLQQLVDSYPQSALAQRARIAIADSHFKQNDETHRAQAAVEYQTFISLYPFSEWAAYSQFQLGMLRFRRMRIAARDQTETRDALQAFQRVVSEYPGSQYADQARQKAVECQDRLAEHELTVGIFYYKRKSYASAVSRFKLVMAEYPNFSQMDKLYFYLGESLAKDGKRDEAVPYYQKVADKSPPSEYKQKSLERLREFGPK